MALPSIKFFGNTAGSLMPFMSGPVFKKGTVPSGATIIADIPNFQATIKSTWPDGSAKNAIIGGRCPIVAGQLTTVQMSIGTPSGGANLTTTDVKDASLTVTIDCGSFGSVTWTGTDWDAPFERWVEGPQMANYRYRKPVGSDSHLVVWCEVTVWPGVQPRVITWLENGYTKKAGVTNKVVNYTVTINGTQRESGTHDLKHHARPILTSGSKTHHWGGSTDLSVMARADVDYLIGTRILPPYMSSVRGPAFDASNKFAATSSTSRALISTYQPGDIGNFVYDEDRMPNTGYQCCIGLLPTHDAAYLICNTQFDLLYKAVVFNAYAIGRYSIFRRDENTNQPPSIVTHQTLVLNDGSSGPGTSENVSAIGQSENGNVTPPTSGGANAGWDVAHSPRAGLLAYILTGEKLHIETMQAVFTTNWLSINSYNNRAGVRARFTPDYGAVQTRQTAWGMNSLANLATIFPDADPLKAEYLAEATNHINYYHATYAVGGNQFGVIEPGEEYGDIVTGHQAVSPWQMDFVTAAYGHLLAQDLNYASSATKTKLKAFFAWKAQTIIGRLNGYGGYVWENFAAFYRMSVGTQGLANYYPNKTGFLASWAQVYTESASPNYPYASPGTGIISTEFGDSLAAQGMLGNAQPGLAYAVEEGIPGAPEAYARMISASNWAANLASFKNSPVWAMEPVNIQSSLGAPMTTPGPSFRWDSAPLIANSFMWDTRMGIGAPLGEYASTGTDAPSIIQALKVSGDNPLSEARTRYISTPTGFVPDGNGGYSSPVGAVNYEAYLDGASLGQATDTITSGSADSTVPVMTGVISSSSITASGFTLSWSAASDNVAVTGYEVSTNGGTSYVNAGNVLSVSKTGLTSSTAYPCRVRAYDAAGNKATPLSLTVNTSAAADSTAPTMQGSLTISAITSGGFTVGWAAASDNVAVTGYELSTDNGSTYVNVASVLSYACTGKSASTLYNVKVRAYDAAGNRSTPLSTTATTSASSDTTAPSFTGSLTVTNITTGGFTVTWPSATDNVAVAGYEISIDSGTPAYVALGNVLTNTKTGLASATQFNVRVRAFDAAGNRSAALTTSVTTATATALATSVTVTFQDRASTLKANLTGMKWAWFDQVTPDNLQAPTAKGTLATTNSSGVTVLNITGTQLPPGAVGWLIFSNSDGTATQTNLVSFAGPCVVA